MIISLSVDNIIDICMISVINKITYGDNERSRLSGIGLRRNLFSRM